MELTTAALAAELCGVEADDELLSVLCAAAEQAWKNPAAKRCDPGGLRQRPALRGSVYRSGGLPWQAEPRGEHDGGRSDGAGAVRRLRKGAGGGAGAVRGAAYGALRRIRAVLLSGGAGMSGLSEVLKQLGDKMVLKNREGQRPIRAFIQPVPTREEVIPGEKTAIGWVDHCLWSYTGMEEVQPGDILVWLKTPYRVRTSRAYYVGGKLHHWWASLEEAREAAE